MKKAYFIDIDTLIDIDQKAWIVDKNEPNIPIYKISKIEFNLIRNGVFRSQNNRISFNGNDYWLPTELNNKLKILCKNLNINVGNLAISLQEFFNKEIISKLSYSINEYMIDLLKNKIEDVYLISSKQTRLSYEHILKSLKDKLNKSGIIIKGFYYISDNFYEQKIDTIKLNKLKLFIQHLVGYKTDNNKFIDDEIIRYDKIYYYDNELDTIEYSLQINSILELLLSISDDNIRQIVIENIKDFKPVLYINRVTDNELNRYEKDSIILNVSSLKIFENVLSYSEYKNISG